MIETIEMQVPVRLLFTVPADVTLADLVQKIDAMFENGSLRDSFNEVASQMATNAVADLDMNESDELYDSYSYDGYGIDICP